MAFYVGPPGGAFNPYMLTAGHCLNTNEEWFTCAPACRTYNTGTQSTRNYAGSIGIYGSDNGILRVDAHTGARADGWTLYPGYWNWSVAGLSTVRSYYPYDQGAYHANNAPAGMVVCKNGRSTATTCGQIIDNFYDVQLDDDANGDPNVTSMLRIQDMCVVGGDSGSPVTAAASETAVGIVSAGNAVNMNMQCNPTGPQAIAEPVGRALTQLGVVIYGG